MSKQYLPAKEIPELVRNMTDSELILYSTVYSLIPKNTSPEDLKNDNLAKLTGLPLKTVMNCKSSLKKKGYMVIAFGKNSQGKTTGEVYIGKDVVSLFMLNLNVSITDGKAYEDLLHRFDLLNPSFTDAQREEAVEKANEYYNQHYVK